MKVVILGGGISGLSAAWGLRTQYPAAKITLIEKQNRLGGFIETSREGGFLFEKGPRTFEYSRSSHLLSLIHDMGLSEELIFADPRARQRYLWLDGRLRSLPSLVLSLLPGLLLEPYRKKKMLDDESIYDFATRRFGKKIAEKLFDPLTLGIYGGDIHKLSIRSCFPYLWQLERESKSLLFSVLFPKKKRQKKGLFTLQTGMGRLIEKLIEKTSAEVVLNCEAEEIRSDGVIARGQFYPADLIISALPGSVIGDLAKIPHSFSELDLWVVNLAYKGDVLPKKGYGYLVPSVEQENLLGMIWDSSIFPQQNREGETRITAMMREGSVGAAMDAMQRHLRVAQEPIFSNVVLAKKAIPQFFVGYSEKLLRFQKELKEKFPSIVLVGNYLEGASVDACVASSSAL